MSGSIDRLAIALGALDLIGIRLAASLADSSGTFPMTAQTVRSTEGTIALERDAFLQRFQQVSEHMLRKLFPRLWAAIGRTDDFLPMRDLLDALHRAGLIDDPLWWLDILELRNRLTHEYALNESELAQDINAAWTAAPLLLAQTAHIRAYALDHHLLPQGSSL